MVEVIGGIGAAGMLAWGGVSGLFQYNQGLWQFDKDQRQNRVYQAQGMAVSQVELWREDLRDLFDLTNTKMDNYTTVSTLVVGFTIGMFIDYHLDPDAPTWIFLVASIHNGAAFAYALLSMIFSMYASIVVQQFQTKTMTEIVRLPIPEPEAITDGSAIGRHFENPKNVKMMMRLPVVGSRSKAHAETDTTKQTLNPFVTGVPHMKMFQEMQNAWMPLANFARVSMISSLASMTYALIYFVISRHMAQGRQMWGTAAAVIILTCVNLLLQKVDFMISQAEWIYKVFVHTVPPIFGLIMQIMTMLHDKRWSDYGAPIVFMGHAFWLMFLLQAASPSTEGGKSKFRLTILQEMQFGREGKEEMATPESMASQATAASQGGSMASGGLPSVDETHNKSFGARSVASVEDPQEKLRNEVDHYYRTAASLLGELQQSKSSGTSHYQEELRALARWGGLGPEDTVDTGESVAGVSDSQIFLSMTTEATGDERRDIAAVDAQGVIRTSQPHNFSSGDGVLSVRGAGSGLQVKGAIVPDGTLYYVKSVDASTLTLHQAPPNDEKEEPAIRFDAGTGMMSQLRKLPLVCAAGHPLKEKHGQTIFHLHNRFCHICRRDLERKETRYTCDSCVKYDVCLNCAKQIQSGRNLPGTGDTSEGDSGQEQAGSRAATKKTERMLKSALADLRVRIAKLDSTGDKAEPSRRNSLTKLLEPESSNVKVLPSPIVQDKLEDAMNAEATQDIDRLPWEIFRSITSIIILCFFLSFVWAIVNACTPDHHLGRPHESITTGRENYLDLGGDAERRRLNASGIPSWIRPMRGIARTITAARRQEDRARQRALPVPELTSSVAQVEEWLRALDLPPAVAEKAASQGVDGVTLRYLDQQAWMELGVDSGVERAKLLAKLARHTRETLSRAQAASKAEEEPCSQADVDPTVSAENVTV